MQKVCSPRLAATASNQGLNSLAPIGINFMFYCPPSLRTVQTLIKRNVGYAMVDLGVYRLQSPSARFPVMLANTFIPRISYCYGYRDR